MKSTDSSGRNISIRDNEHAQGDDFNPYAYPYFHSDHNSYIVYDLIVRFGRLWREDAGNDMDILVKQIQYRCKSEPQEVQWKDSCGDTALHRLCQAARLPSLTTYGDVSNLDKTQYFVDICHTILEVYPHATVATNNWKETPLHQFSNHCGLPSKLPPHTVNLNNLHSKNNKSNPILTFFLQLTRHGAIYRRNWWESHALHDACELQGLETLDPTSRTMARSLVVNAYEGWLQQIHLQMIDHFLRMAPRSIYAKDDSGSTPLHRATQSCVTSSSVVRKLVEHLLKEEHKEQSKIFLANHSPLITLVSHFFDPSEKFPKQSISDQILHQLDSDKQTKPIEMVTQLGSLWTNTILLCAAQVYQTIGPISRLTKPLVHALVQTGCPYCCIRLAMRLYPNELRQYNDNGETVLTLSLSGESYYRQDEPDQTSWRAILEVVPDLASMPNTKGQLPLHIAISKQMMTWENGLQEIFAANPSAISTPDVSTRLYPFLQTGAGGDISSSFELLRADPSVIIT